MMNELQPSVGQWYRRYDKGEMFRVIAVDPKGNIEVQSFGGDLEELDGDTWRASAVEAVAAPEDCTGPYDELEEEDLGYSETLMSRRDWRVLLESEPLLPEAWLEAVVMDEV